MILINTVTIGLREIASHWFRSLLTIIGVVLGIVSLVTMSAIVQGTLARPNPICLAARFR